MGRITRETIDRIFETSRIEEVVGEFVQLKRSGASLKGLSPFTNEKTPSFFVIPAKQIFKDFSSGKGGTVVTFLMEHEHFTYPEALRYLAKKYNIEVEEEESSAEDQQAATQRESLYVVSEYAQRYFEETLWESAEGQNIGLSYFRERGFTDETIRAFHLGYAPEARTAFSDEALKKGYQAEFLEASGLSIRRDDKLLDRFWGRVIFPIHSLSGRTLGFGGRVLRKDAKAAKYLNSPESDIYHKSKILYGLYQAKSEIVKADKCLLVEGYTDVLSMWQAGVRNVVSSSGTALTADQVRLIQRLTKNITILFDSDPAGIKASFRGIDMILEAGLNVRVLTLPEGDDPDSFARKHPAHELTDYFEEEETDFIRFKAKLLMADSKGDPITKANMIRDIVQSIALIPDDISRDVYLRECASIMAMEEKVLYSELAQLRKKHLDELSRRQPERKRMEVVREGQEKQETPVDDTTFLAHVQDSLHYSQEEAIIWLLLNHGDKPMEYQIEPEKEGDPDTATEPIASFMLEDLRYDAFEFANGIFQETFDAFMKAWTDEERILSGLEFTRSENRRIASMASDLMTERYTLSDWKSKDVFVVDREANLSRFVTEVLLRFKACKVEKMIREESERVQNNEGGDIQSVMVRIKKLSDLRNKINAELNRVL